MENKNRNLIFIIVGVLLLMACCCVVVGSAGVYFLLRDSAPSLDFDAPASDAPGITRVPPAAATPKTGLNGTPEPALRPSGVAATPDAEALALYADEMPPANPRLLAMRLNPKSTNIPETVASAAPTYQVGDTQVFWISNSDTQEHKQITAELKVLTDHVAMWVQNGVRYDQKDLAASAKRFEEQTYPTNREFFGSEWSPGVDNDVRLHILHARGLGDTVAGYFSSADEYSRMVNEYSNEREMFYISADAGSSEPNSEFYDGTLAHEFQHMIHWANDRNETSWVNEGMSELAALLNGFDPGGADYAYVMQPDTQLTTWGDPASDEVMNHYGASYLFTAYFLDRFGEKLTQAVVASPKNGIAGYNDALEKAGRPERFDDIFADWVIANLLDQPGADAQGRYGYSDIDIGAVSMTDSFGSFPVSIESSVSQYGVDYYEFTGDRPVTISFAGDAQIALVDATLDGGSAWWSNRGDQSNSTLTRAVDLRQAQAATLTFDLWFDIEEGWDYAYVEASTDGGQHWQILSGRHTTDDDPVGNAFGPGWTGKSGGGERAKWVQERVDLSAYAGQELQLRFEMVTDDAVNEPGLLIDNIEIPEIGFADDTEAGSAGWEAAGWLSIDNSVAQRWLVQVVSIAETGDITVQTLPVDDGGLGQLTLADLSDLERAVLVVSALAPVTTEAAPYRFEINR